MFKNKKIIAIIPVRKDSKVIKNVNTEKVWNLFAKKIILDYSKQ